MTTKLTEKNISSVANAGINWQSVIVADGSTGTTGVAGRGYFINTTSAAHTFTLPATATFADTIIIKDYAGTFATNKLTIARNGHKIQGADNNSLIGTNRASIILVYVDVTRGWEYVTESNVGDLGAPVFISATGGTILTSGNFKTHVFTGDGCFAVSQLGNAPTQPTGGPQNVDYLVVAGGGNGSSGGGGGAGGYRTSFPSPGCNAGSFPITLTTYPISVGAGGGGNGVPSTFSTITSAGGGTGGFHASAPAKPGGSGGSGGGGSSNSGSVPGGSGNTPPVSPPQGNGGGGSGPAAPCITSGGGGGAGGTGSASPGPTGGAAGNGGVGATIADSFFGPTAPSYGTPGPAPGRYFAGGGGGANHAGSPAGNSTGGSGGGGPGVAPPAGGTAGTVNTGGGGGGSIQGSGRDGGSGIVVIRYKFQ
jgi:hypothetical protein